MMSPSFECSRDGLRSAVRLRAVVTGRPDPEASADGYMAAYNSRCRRDPGEGSTERLRSRILVVIGDIEHLTSAYPEELTDDGL